jgi:sRNA-binding carbon storage regulator CsrA
MSGNLVISRKHGQCVWIGDVCVKVEFSQSKGRQVRLVISAPSHINVMRGELQPEKSVARCCPVCRKDMAQGWEYAVCESCGKLPCRHGKQPHDCNECLFESDLMFDANRENS